MLGIEECHAEDALHSERVAKHVISRRSFFGAAGALAGAAVFSIPTPMQDEVKRLTAPKHRGSMLTQFDALLKERYMDAGSTGMLIMNPADHSSLLAIARGNAYKMTGTVAESFRSLDRRPLTGT
jgi:hypothetical protein